MAKGVRKTKKYIEKGELQKPERMMVKRTKKLTRKGWDERKNGLTQYQPVTFSEDVI